MTFCEIKAIDRYYNMINLGGHLNTTINQIHFKLLKRESGGWHPFLYAMKVDVCQFFKSPRSLFIPNLIYSFLKTFTNVNHTCPYLAGSVLRLWNWTPDETGVLRVFPVDHWQYGVHTKWYANKLPMIQINGSVMFFK